MRNIINFILLSLILFFTARSQEKVISLEKALEIAIENNLGLMASEQHINKRKNLIGSALDIDKSEIYFNSDAANIAPNGEPLGTWGVSQSLEFPTVYGAKRGVMKSQLQLSKDQYQLDKLQLIKEVHLVYDRLLFLNQMLENYLYLDSLYSTFEEAANKKFNNGESNLLEKLTFATKKKEISIELSQTKESIKRNYIIFNSLLQSDNDYQVQHKNFIKIELIPLKILEHPQNSIYDDSKIISNRTINLERQRLLPDINLTFFQGVNNGGGQEAFNGFEIGLTLPIWFGSQRSKIKAAQTEEMITEIEKKNFQIILKAKYETLISDIARYQKEIDYYNETGKELSDETLFHAKKAYQGGEIDFLQYAQLLENAKNIELNYLKSLRNYNRSVLKANYITN